MSDFETYEYLQSVGIEPKGAFLKAKEIGMNRIVATKMLREVYGLNLTTAKEVIVEVDSGGLTLSEYQKSLLPELRHAFENKKSGEG